MNDFIVKKKENINDIHIKCDTYYLKEGNTCMSN